MQRAENKVTGSGASKQPLATACNDLVNVHLSGSLNILALSFLTFHLPVEETIDSKTKIRGQFKTALSSVVRIRIVSKGIYRSRNMMLSV